MICLYFITSDVTIISLIFILYSKVFFFNHFHYNSYISSSHRRMMTLHTPTTHSAVAVRHLRDTGQHHNIRMRLFEIREWTAQSLIKIISYYDIFIVFCLILSVLILLCYIFYPLPSSAPSCLSLS